MTTTAPTPRTQVHRLHVASTLYRFIDNQVLPGTDASMAPGFQSAEELARSKSTGGYWANKNKASQAA